MSLTFTLAGGKIYVQGLQKLAGKIASPKKVLARMAQDAIDKIKAHTMAGKDRHGRRLIPSKRAGRDDGQTLVDKGGMLGALRVLTVSDAEAEIGFASTKENQKALWAQEGTVAHEIWAKPGSALAWASSMSFATHMKSRGGKSKRMTMANARSGAKGMVVANHVHHPGTPPRPFFGLTHKEKGEIVADANAWMDGMVKESGL